MRAIRVTGVARDECLGILAALGIGQLRMVCFVLLNMGQPGGRSLAYGGVPLGKRAAENRVLKGNLYLKLKRAEWTPWCCNSFHFEEATH